VVALKKESIILIAVAALLVISGKASAQEGRENRGGQTYAGQKRDLTQGQGEAPQAPAPPPPEAKKSYAPLTQTTPGGTTFKITSYRAATSSEVDRIKAGQAALLASRPNVSTPTKREVVDTSGHSSGYGTGTYNPDTGGYFSGGVMYY
jgi:hypothetical protein